jgi:toxin FitB
VIVVDSCGWVERLAGTALAHLYDEAFRNVDDLVVPSVCLVEVWRTIQRETDEPRALAAVAAMRQARVAELGADLAVAAGRLGRAHGLPLADSIIFATAQWCHAELWTQDAHFRGLPDVRYIEPAAK